MRKAVVVALRVTFALLVTLVGLFVLSVCIPHPRVTKRPLSLAEFTAEFSRRGFPSTATNIYFGRSSVSLGGRAHIYRFEAPLEDCITFAKAEFERYNKHLFDNPADYLPSDPVPIDFVGHAPFKPDLSHFWLNDLDWFDVDRIEEGLTIPQHPRGHHPLIWVDTRRGILYCWWTD